MHLRPDISGSDPRPQPVRDRLGQRLAFDHSGRRPPGLHLDRDFKLDPSTGSTFAGTKDVSVGLPPGLVGNPTHVPVCPNDVFVASATDPNTACPRDTQIGVVSLNLYLGFPGGLPLTEPLYNLPAPDNSPARLGFVAVNIPVFINFAVRSDSDYGLNAIATGATDFYPINSITTTVWGVPADSSHDFQRFSPSEAANTCYGSNGEGTCPDRRPSGSPLVPFMTNPTNCDPGKHVDFAVDSYQTPGTFTASAPLPQITGCNQLPFNPTIDLQPTTNSADSPSGLDVDLQQNQGGLLQTNALGPAHLRKAVVTLP